MGPTIDIDEGRYDKTYEVNLRAPLFWSQHAWRSIMSDRGGAIINVASIGGLRCMPGAPAYGASKAGLIFLTQQAALEYGPFGVRCNAVCPGATRTERRNPSLRSSMSDIMAKIDVKSTIIISEPGKKKSR